LGDKQAHETVIACLHDADDLVSRAAARALIRLGDAQDIEVLIPLLDDQLAAPGASIALGTLGGERAFPILASRLKEASGGRRATIISALGATGDTRAIPLLLPLLREESRSARGAAVEALGTLRATQAVEQILPMLQDEDTAVRQNAARALGQFGDARAVTPLLQALQDPDWFVPGLAALALGALGDARAIAPLQGMLHTLPRRDMYRQIARALEHLKAASSPGEDHPHAVPTQ
jgi:HEAT repeat protein